MAYAKGQAKDKEAHDEQGRLPFVKTARPECSNCPDTRRAHLSGPIYSILWEGW